VFADAQIETWTGEAVRGQGRLEDHFEGGMASRPPAAVLGGPALLRRVAWYVGEHPATTVYLGDGGQVGCRQEVQALFRVLDLIDAPTVFVPGNHDCFLLGAVADNTASSAAAIASAPLLAAESAAEAGGRWQAACAAPDGAEGESGPANKSWLVEKLAARFAEQAARRPDAERPYWRALRPPPDPGAPDDLWAEHKRAWLAQIFPAGAVGGPGRPLALVVAIDTTDWSEPGQIMGGSPGAQGCVSQAQADAVVRAVAEMRAADPDRPLRTVVVGHHPIDLLRGAGRPFQCAATFKVLLRELGATDYVSAHTHVVRPSAVVRLRRGLSDSGAALDVTEHVIGSVVEYDEAGGPPEIERLDVAADGSIARRSVPVPSLVAEPAAGASGVCCGEVWAAAPTRAETVEYRRGVALDTRRSLWLELSLDYVAAAGRVCGGGPCASPVTRCASAHEDAAALAAAVPSAPSSWKDHPALALCVDEALGLTGTRPAEVDPRLERFVVCGALRAAAAERGIGLPESRCGSGAPAGH
jgi:hypothetical protein